MAGHKCSCYLHVLYNILGFRLIRRVSGIRGFRFWGWIFTRIDFRGGFGFQVRVSVLGAQTLHPIRTRPVAIFNIAYHTPWSQKTILTSRVSLGSTLCTQGSFCPCCRCNLRSSSCVEDSSGGHRRILVSIPLAVYLHSVV